MCSASTNLLPSNSCTDRSSVLDSASAESSSSATFCSSLALTALLVVSGMGDTTEPITTEMPDTELSERLLHRSALHLGALAVRELLLRILLVVIVLLEELGTLAARKVLRHQLRRVRPVRLLRGLDVDTGTRRHHRLQLQRALKVRRVKVRQNQRQRAQRWRVCVSMRSKRKHVVWMRVRALLGHIHQERVFDVRVRRRRVCCVSSRMQLYLNSGWVLDE